MSGTKYSSPPPGEHSWFIFYIGKASLPSIEGAFAEAKVNYHLWIPTYKIHRIKKSDVLALRKKAFPGYIFVSFPDGIPNEYRAREAYLTGVESSLKNTDPQFKLLREPSSVAVPLSYQQVHDIQEALEDNSREEQVVAAYQVNDYVKIISGPFADTVGQVESIQAKKIVLKVFFLGKKVRMEIPPDHLQFLVDQP